MDEHMPTSSFRTILDLQPGDHLCWLYETEQERWLLLLPFLQQGLERQEKVLCFMEPPVTDIPLRYLRDAGVDVKPYLASGQLSILRTDQVYLRHGRFTPEAMMELVQTEMERALAEGYAALRASGDMAWALRKVPGSHRLIEYESRINEFFPANPCIALCQYDRRRFEPATLLRVLATHPSVVLGTEMYDNCFYGPPLEPPDQDMPAFLFHHAIDSVIRCKRAQTARYHDQSKAATQMIALKREVNALVSQLGQPPRYEV